MHAAPAYIAETCPPSVRGLLISAKEAAIVSGILIGFTVTDVLAPVEGGWRLTYGLAAPVAALLGIGMVQHYMTGLTLICDALHG